MTISVLSRKLNTMLHTPRIFMLKFEHTPLFSLLPDELALKIQYKNRFLKNLDLKNPKTFNEKLQWLKLYDRRPEYTTMVDKYAVKEYVANQIGWEYIIPTYGVWDRFEDIDFDSLPNEFVLKCTHGSGDVVICKDKLTFDFEYAKNRLTNSLNTNYYKVGREWPYKNVKPRIIAEQYLADLAKNDLIDYKLMCFAGEHRMTFTCTNRFSEDDFCVTFFDCDWNQLPFRRSHPSEVDQISKPVAYELMVLIAEKLSNNIPFLRVDFYEVDGRIYFGELTFFPGGGFEIFQPDKWDEILGEWIVLPEKYEP